jgi:hypothetical protein
MIEAATAIVIAVIAITLVRNMPVDAPPRDYQG